MIFLCEDAFSRILWNSIESDKSLKHELGSVYIFSLLPVSSWHCANITLPLIQEVFGSNTFFLFTFSHIL